MNSFVSEPSSNWVDETTGVSLPVSSTPQAMSAVSAVAGPSGPGPTIPMANPGVFDSGC